MPLSSLLNAPGLARFFHKGFLQERWCFMKLNENGQGLAEYMILLMLVAVASIVATKTLGKTVRDKISFAKNHIAKCVDLNTNDCLK